MILTKEVFLYVIENTYFAILNDTSSHVRSHVDKVRQTTDFFSPLIFNQVNPNLIDFVENETHQNT